MTLTPTVITPEQIAKIDDAHNWQTTAGRAEAFRAILSLNNAAWAEMLADRQKLAICIAAGAPIEVAKDGVGYRLTTATPCGVANRGDGGYIVAIRARFGLEG